MNISSNFVNPEALRRNSMKIAPQWAITKKAVNKKRVKIKLVFTIKQNAIDMIRIIPSIFLPILKERLVCADKSIFYTFSPKIITSGRPIIKIKRNTA